MYYTAPQSGRFRHKAAGNHRSVIGKTDSTYSGR